MKTFEKVIKHLESMGYFYIPNSRFNKRQLKLSLQAICAIFSFCMWLFNVAETPKEYMNGIFMITAVTLVLISRLSTILKMPTLIFCNNQFIEIIEQSE